MDISDLIVRVTLVSNMATVIMIFDTAVPIPLRLMWVPPNIVITSIMACRVYRRTRSHISREVEISTANGHLPKSALPMKVDINLGANVYIDRESL